ncbi:MAG TPA: NAD(P)H-quinone oxidoreductase [Trueperaceae bacterium]
MQAILVQADHSLALQDAPDPVPGPGQALIEVHAAGLNRADLSQRAGHYPPPAGESDILGLEVAGVIRQLGAGATGWQPGDRVCTLLGGGGYAELAVAPTAMLMPVPAGWSFQQAAGLPEVFLTAFLNLFLEGLLQQDERVLIHGGASGVGTAAIQLASLAGCHVFATAGSDEKTTVCRQLGAELAINYRQEDFVERVREHTAGAGVDLVLDMVGADYLSRNLEALATCGRLVFISTLSGRRTELDIRVLMGKRLTLKGSTLRSRPLDEKVRIKQALLERFWRDFEAGRLEVVMDSVYPLRDAEAAHARMRENQNIGKIVLEVRGES